MEIRLNGKRVSLQDPQKLRDFLETLKITAEMQGVAIAKNGRIVPRANWETSLIFDGDELEVIHAAQGG